MAAGGNRPGRARPPARLSPEDEELWQAVARTARPLAARPRPPAPADGLEGKDEDKNRNENKGKGKDRPPRAAPGGGPRRPPGPPPPPPVPALDRRTLVRLGRSRIEVEAVIDLHGLHRQEAQERLLAFLAAAQREGRRFVLVITGKGRADGDSDGTGGVLRRALPRWLELAPFRALVAGAAPAHRRHGGAGAFYLRLRRPRAVRG